MKIFAFHNRSWNPRRRGGMALMLVMIGLIVCSILTAGFLSSQGTSIGIVRNERDVGNCRQIAQTGIDMCYWLVRNESDRRETMTPGTWLNAMAVGDGTASVSVADGAGSSSFATDPTQGIVVTSTGTYDNRSYTLTASIRPTGGGAVFANGNFVYGNIALGNTDLLTTVIVDSYNSTVAAYNALSPGTNAAFNSNATAGGSLTIYLPTILRGSYTAGPTAVLSSVLNLLGLLAIGPTSMSNEQEVRTAGTTILPNTTGLAYQGSWNKNNVAGANNFPGPGRYDAASAQAATITINQSGLYYITGNLQIQNNAGSTLAIGSGVSATVMVDGDVTVNNKITLNSGSQLTLYAGHNVTMNNGSINLNGNTANFRLMGASTAPQIQITNSSTIVGSIFAPQTSVVMQNGSPKLYGAIIAHDLTVENTAQVHFDEALRSLKVSNIAGGSAAPGSPDYRVTILGGAGIGR